MAYAYSSSIFQSAPNPISFELEEENSNQPAKFYFKKHTFFTKATAETWQKHTLSLGLTR